ncbi:MAG: hypothetical protein NUV98_05040 [Candidatus Roizmanbacteria bacterium]|nr:hypothetical protein [Candidatus Roizmanbacteria bacterium]
MNKRFLLIGIITFVILAVAITLFVINPGNPQKCGDGICDAKELANLNLCPKDCINKCGNEICESEESCSNCEPDCGRCSVTSGESRFGIHIGRLDLRSEISELGDIYSRINFGADAFGWKLLKGAEASRSQCRACCDPARSDCSCVEGFYYCTPDNRGNIIGKDTADEFYADNYEILFMVAPSSYDQNEPKNSRTVGYPAEEQTYKDYIGYLVRQYPGVKYWEVFNEANNRDYWGDTAENYARLVTLTSDEIKRYCPECKVGISLTSATQTAEWFNTMTSLCNSIEFMDLHQYESNNMDALKEFEESHLTSWKNSCPGVEIISTETGVVSEPITFKGRVWELGTSETAQAQDSIKYLTMMFNAGYGKIYYYLFDVDYVPGLEDIYEHNGLLNEDGSKKIAFGTYQLMIEKLDHFTSITKLTEGQYKYTFSNKSPVYVLWCDSRNCSLSSEISGTVKVTNYLGNEETKQASQIVLSESPIFVE